MTGEDSITPLRNSIEWAKLPQERQAKCVFQCTSYLVLRVMTVVFKVSSPTANAGEMLVHKASLYDHRALVTADTTNRSAGSRAI